MENETPRAQNFGTLDAGLTPWNGRFRRGKRGGGRADNGHTSKREGKQFLRETRWWGGVLGVDDELESRLSERGDPPSNHDQTLLALQTL